MLNQEIKNWRTKEGFTQKEISELIGITRGTYQRFEQLGAAGLKSMALIQKFYNDQIKTNEMMRND